MKTVKHWNDDNNTLLSLYLLWPQMAQTKYRLPTSGDLKNLDPLYLLPIFSTLNNLNCTLLWVFQSSDTNQRTRNPSVVYLIPDRISKAVALLSAIIRKTTTTTKNEHNEIHESSENYSTFSYRSMPDTFGDSISKV